MYLDCGVIPARYRVRVLLLFISLLPAGPLPIIQSIQRIGYQHAFILATYPIPQGKMSDNTMSTSTGSESVNPADLKGKGKAADPPQDMSMDEEESSSDEEAVDEVSASFHERGS